MRVFSRCFYTLGTCLWGFFTLYLSFDNKAIGMFSHSMETSEMDFCKSV